MASPPTSPSPPSLLRFHPRGPPPAIRPGVTTSYYSPAFAAVPASPQRFLNAAPGPHYNTHQQQSHSSGATRKSPRQLKLQKVEPFALRLTQVSTSFRHELFQFHQLLRDAMATSHQQQQQQLCLAKGPVYDNSVFELLTSDRGDAVLKELFRQWQTRIRKRSAAALIADVEDNGDGDDADDNDSEVLWDVLETFFKSVPLVLPESDVANAKSYFRYLDALKSLRDVLLALLYKSDRDPKPDDEDEDEDESSLGLSLGFLLPPSKHKSGPHTHRRLIPMHVYCQQLERELQKLRERHPSRSRVAGFRASLKRNERQDTGLLNDTTVLLLLDFWELPKTERLGFFCQIASQTNEADAGMVLRVFLENCSTHNFLQVWDALQQSPQFEATFAVAARKYYEALMAQQSSGLTAEVVDAAALIDDSQQQRKKSLKPSRKDGRRSTRGRPSLSIGRNGGNGHRQSRFVDLNGLTEVFEERDDEFLDNSDSDSDRSNGNGDDDSSDGSDDSRKHGRRFQKIMIRERGRTPPDERHNKLNRQRRRQQHHRSGRESKTPTTGGQRPGSPSAQTTLNLMQVQLPPVNLQASLIQRLHDDLVELIKQDELSETSGKFGASPVVMDSVWKLLELLDKGKQPSKGSSSRHLRSDNINRQSLNGSGLIAADSDPLSSTSRSNSVRPEHRQTLADALGANLTRDQQFMIKFDQLQSLLTSLGSFSLHEMTTDTISNVYRRMPAVAKLFTGVHEKTYAAAGVDVPTAGSLVGARLNLCFDGVGHSHQQPQPGMHGPNSHRQSVMMAPMASLTSADDQVIEAASVLMAKVGKMVRSLVNLDQLSSSNSNGKSPSLDVLAILKLADDMESESGGGQDEARHSSTSTGKPIDLDPSRRSSLLDHSRRLAILHKLRALAMSNELDAIAEMVSESVKDAHEQHVQQAQQIELLSSGSTAAGGAKRRRHRQVFDGDATRGGDEDDEDDEDVADEVLKMAKKAKTRRASAAKAHSHSIQDASGENGDDDEDSDPPLVNTGRRDLLLNIKQQASGQQQKGLKLFSVGILLRIIYQVRYTIFDLENG